MKVLRVTFVFMFLVLCHPSISRYLPRQWGLIPNCGYSATQSGYSTTQFRKSAELKPPYHILGGVTANRTEFPHMVLLGYGTPGNRDSRCAGSLISERFVLSAAHCSSNIYDPVTYVTMGITDKRNLTDEGLQEIPVSQIINHPGYVYPRLYNDIALLRLSRPVKITEYVRPACYIPVTNPEKAIATGWGRYSEYSNEGSDELMKVELTLQPSNYCRSTYRASRRLLPYGFYETTQICAGEYNRGKDACQGDSGGPLQILINNPSCLYTIVGITSFGVNCGYVPGVYTRVSHYIPWIESIVRL